jgi:hypothetical protein
MKHFLARASFDGFVNIISRNRTVFAHSKTGDALHLVRSDRWLPETHLLGPFRPVEPLKELVFPPREALGSLTGDANPSAKEERIVIGVKGCDLSSLDIHDYVFKGEPADPYYVELREKTVIVTCDCADACEVCFCTAMNAQPYPKKGFDINLSPVSNGYVVETGTPRGEQLCEAARQYLKPAEQHSLAERDKNRESLYKKARRQRRGLKPGKTTRRRSGKPRNQNCGKSSPGIAWSAARATFHAAPATVSSWLTA